MDPIIRYDNIIAAGEEIYDLLEVNFRLLHGLPLLPKVKAGAQEGEGGDEGAPGTVVQLLLNAEDDDDDKPVVTHRKTIAEQTEEAAKAVVSKAAKKSEGDEGQL